MIYYELERYHQQKEGIMNLTFSLSNHSHHSQPLNTLTYTWDEWVAMLLTHTEASEKNGPALSFCTFENAHRKNDNARDICALGLDLDGLPKKDTFRTILDKLSPFEYVYYSSYSHDPTKSIYKYRVILPLDKPTNKQTFAWVWNALNALIGGWNDPQTKNASRIFYIPSAPKERLHLTESGSNRTGRFLSLVDLEPYRRKHAGRPKKTEVKDLRAFRESFVSFVPEKHREMARAAMYGESFAETERHHDKLLLTRYLAEFKDNIPRDQFDLLFDELAKYLSSTGNDTPQEALDKLWHAYEGYVPKLRKLRALEAQSKESEQEPYTEAELQEIADKYSPDKTIEKIPWIIQLSGSSMLILGGLHGYHGPIDCNRSLPSLNELLGRAPVVYTIVNPQGMIVARPLDQVIAEYGIRTPDDIRYTYEETTLNRSGNFVSLKRCMAPRSQLRPAYHKDVDTWLRMIGGNKCEKFLDWMSCVPKTTHPLCALNLTGDGGIGKGLLVAGLGRVWEHSSPNTFRSVFLSDFNDGLQRNPLIHADEKLDKESASLLREGIGSNLWSINVKMQPRVPLEGYPRIIITDNTGTEVQVPGGTEAELQATAVRILRVHPRAIARDFVESLPRPAGDFFRFERMIAEHVLWLSENHVLVHKGRRFLVDGDMHESHSMLMLTNNLNAAIIDFLYSLIFGDELVYHKTRGDLGVVDGNLYIKRSLLKKEWAKYTSFKQVSTQRITRGLNQLRIEVTQKYINGDKHMSLYIDPKRLGPYFASADGRNRAAIITDMIEIIKKLEK